MIVVCHKPGQLGNRLFLFAHLIAAAAERNSSVFFPGFSDYAQYFSGPSRGITPHYPASAQTRTWPPLLREPFYIASLNALRLAKRGLLPGVVWFETSVWDERRMVNIGDEAFLNLVGSRLILCGGFFYRSSPLLKKHVDRVRAYFALTPEMMSYASRVERSIRHPKWRSIDDRIVGVHIRRRDYRVFKNGIYYFGLDVFAAYMRRVRQLLGGRCRFVVCCEEPVDKSLFAEFDIIAGIVGSGEVMGDLLALSACDYIIGPPSTFSGWASFLREVPRYFIKSADSTFIERLQLSDFAVEWEGWT